ncbi:MAG TPA: glycoside hydrolase family 2 TIM barrel-domain containing protein [Solirubrobacteraceae bacterium]|jgi:beta-glucuronidase|nr:glycoside hydrolase family 2 TIM barrel-domain containing protein [Solirubrobacteraceae bacterium]
MAVVLALLAPGVVGLAAGAAPALAQPGVGGPVYTATPPTFGALYRDGPTDRWLLGGTWLYRADTADAGLAAGWWHNVASTEGWSPVAVPNSFNAGDLSPASMNGSVGWYRRDFTIPANAFAAYVPARFRSWIVRFESINYRATVWLNGRKIGAHSGEYLPFEFPLTGVRPGLNRLIVRVDNRRNGGDLPPGNGGWWNYGGINQEVYLRSVQVADMSPVVIRPILPCPTCAAQIQEQVTVRNLTSAAQTLTLHGSYGGAALHFGGRVIPSGGTWVARAAVTIPAPHLWSTTDPYLYRAALTLSDAHGRTLEGYTDYSGIRNISVGSGGQLLLNGRALDLRGFDLHELNVQSGAALSPTQLQAMVGWVRELGGKVIRAHYPLNPQIEEAADRDGILLWSEIPVYQVNSSYLTNASWLNFAHNMLRTNILTNENHPSILVWSIANELQTPPNDAEARYIAGAAQIAHQLDPTRPVGMAISSWPGVACQTAYAPLDVLGFNDYFGWFDAGGGGTDDPDELSPFLDFLHGCYPSKPLMITEFGFEGSQNGPPEQRGTYQYQTAQAAFHLGVFASKPYVAAAMWFALQDFPAKPGWSGGDPFPHPPFVEKGEIDLEGNPVQPLFSAIQSIYTSTAQIAPAPAPARRRTKQRSSPGRRSGSGPASRSRGSRPGL